jgi:hypothetical protein
MSASLSTTLAFALALGFPLSALANSNTFGPVALQDAGPAADTPQPDTATKSPQTSAQQRPAVRDQSEKRQG